MKFVNYKILIGALFIAILALILKNTTQELFRIKESGSYITELEQELTREKARNKFLKERLKYVETDQFIEDEAREKLGLVKRGEFVVQERFEPSVVKEIDEKLNKSNWQQWMELFM